MSNASLSWCRQAAVCMLFLTLSLGALPVAGSSQEVEGYVQVPTSHANVHMGPSSGQQVLWLAPEDTVLPVIGLGWAARRDRATPRRRALDMCVPA